MSVKKIGFPMDLRWQGKKSTEYAFVKKPSNKGEIINRENKQAPLKNAWTFLFPDSLRGTAMAIFIRK